jgi:hypothetical protein
MKVRYSGTPACILSSRKHLKLVKNHPAEKVERRQEDTESKKDAVLCLKDTGSLTTRDWQQNIAKIENT